MRSTRSKFYYCGHVTPKGRHCSKVIQVIGPERDDRAALERADWAVLRSLRDVRCRTHNPKLARRG